jgi:hypothetical protein
MGLGPFFSKPGDVAVVLFGGAMCFVLRPHGLHYELIGDAYVQGAMTGECVKDFMDSTMPIGEKFILC